MKKHHISIIFCLIALTALSGCASIGIGVGPIGVEVPLPSLKKDKDNTVEKKEDIKNENR